MTDEVVELSNDLGLAVEGTSVAWPRGVILRSSAALWSAVEAAYPAEDPAHDEDG